MDRMRLFTWWLAFAALGHPLAAQAQAQAQASSDDAALDLKAASEPEEAKKPAPRALRLVGEVTAGRLSQRFGLPSQDTRRASIDLYWEFKPAAQWRGVLSNRLDDIHPVDPGSRSTLNSLREAYAGWLSEDGQLGFDIGRMNLRNGPAYGFNPTDYFKDGSLRAVTTPDPLSQRENRLGTVMLRVQKLWEAGSLSLAVAPKIDNAPSNKTFSPDFGSTNHANRALVSVSTRFSGKTNAQGLLFYEQGKGAQLGASVTTLFTDAMVGFAEWSGGRDAEPRSLAVDAKPKMTTAHRAALGATYTTASRLALTLEYEYNGFALGKSQWDQLAASGVAGALENYQLQIQRRQDIASRQAVLVYALQRDAFIKNLDLTGLVRYNVDDHSRFAWAEARYHWPSFDVALQWQASSGRLSSEYGSQPGSRLVQLLAAFYF